MHHSGLVLDIQIATGVLENIRDKKDSLTKRVEEKIQPIEIEKEFQSMVKDQKTREEMSEIMEKMIDERIEQFKMAWDVEKEAEIGKIKLFIDNRFQELEESTSNNQREFENRFSEKVEQKSNEESTIKLLEEKFQQRIKEEIDLAEERQLGRHQTEMKEQVTDIRREMIEGQEKLGSELRAEFVSGFGKLKAEIEKELGKVKEESQKRMVDNIGSKAPTVQIIKDEPSEDVEDEFELKMQSEMNQMKERLKQDFSREVQVSCH